jgi:hypothetical protein
MKDVTMAQLSEAAEEVLNMPSVTREASGLVKYLCSEDPIPTDFIKKLHDYTGTVITVTIARICHEFYSLEEMTAKKEEYLSKVTESLIVDIEEYMRKGNDDSI